VNLFIVYNGITGMNDNDIFKERISETDKAAQSFSMNKIMVSSINISTRNILNTSY